MIKEFGKIVIIGIFIIAAVILIRILWSTPPKYVALNDWSNSIINPSEIKYAAISGLPTEYFLIYFKGSDKSEAFRYTTRDEAVKGYNALKQSLTAK
jgi:hypothetical protein